jgi:hypothetical protein
MAPILSHSCLILNFPPRARRCCANNTQLKFVDARLLKLYETNTPGPIVSACFHPQVRYRRTSDFLDACGMTGCPALRISYPARGMTSCFALISFTKFQIPRAKLLAQAVRSTDSAECTVETEHAYAVAKSIARLECIHPVFPRDLKSKTNTHRARGPQKNIPRARSQQQLIPHALLASLAHVPCFSRDHDFKFCI